MADWEWEHHVRNEEEQVVAEARSGRESSDEEGNGCDKQKGNKGLAAKSDSVLTKTKKLAGARQQPNKQINSRQSKTRKRLTTSKIKELMAKFNWLVLDANDESQCHCRICESRMRLTVFHVTTHNFSRKHARGLKRQKRNRAKNAVQSVSTNSEAPSNANVHEPVLEMDVESDTDMIMRSDGSMAEPPAKRLRKRILRANQMTMDMRDVECSEDNFSLNDIINRQEIEGAIGHGNNYEEQSEPHAIDLFFDCIVPTMKSLPLDLAAEGKSAIMQVVCSLEIEAMHREFAKTASPVCTPAPSIPFAGPPATAAAESTAAAPSVQADEDQAVRNNNNNVESTQNKSASGATTASLANIGNPQDLPGNTRRIPSSLQLKVPDPKHPNTFGLVPLHNLLKPNGNGWP